MFKDNDVLNLLFESEKVLGSFNHLDWKVNQGKDSTEAISHLTTIHESYHNELNNATLFGVLLQLYAYLSLYSEKSKETVQSLTNLCTFSHEVYATTMSCLLFNQSQKLNIKQAKTLLENAPIYLNYFETGMKITSDFKGAYLKEQCLISVIFFAFNNKAVVAKVLETGFNAFNVNSISGIEYPDKILNYIGKNLPTNFFKKLWKSFKPGSQYEKSIENFEESEKSIAGYNKAIGVENDEASKALVAHFYKGLQLQFPEINATEIDSLFGTHYFVDLINLANIEFPQADIKNRFKLNDQPYDSERNVLINFHNERIINTKDELIAIVSFLSDYEISDWNKLTVGSNELEHIYMVTRLKEQFYEQYTFSEEDKEKVRSYHSNVIIAIRRSLVQNNQRIVELIFIDSPEQLKLFSEQKNSNVFFLSCISFQTIHHNNWWQQWENVIAETTIPSTLIDLPVFDKFKTYFDNYDILYYKKTIIEIDDNKRIALALLCKKDESYNLYLLPCSEIVAKSFVHYAKNEMKEGKFKEMEIFSEIKQLINLNLSHLYREERYFHLNIIANENT